MAAPRKPQDHKPKADAPFTFEADGKTLTLPKIDETIMEKIPGGIVEDSLFSPEGEVKLAFSLLRAVEGHDEAKQALRAMPFGEMSKVLMNYLQTASNPGE